MGSSVYSVKREGERERRERRRIDDYILVRGSSE